MKIGGIGAVLEGLLCTDTYNRHVSRTILAGPFPVWDEGQMARILSPHSRLQVRYASRYNIFGLVETALGRRLLQAEQELNIGIFYAETSFGPYRHEILLVDPTQMDPVAREAYTAGLQAEFSIEAGRYSYDLEWQLFIDLAVPLMRVLDILATDTAARPAQRFLIAHDWMGLPTALAARLGQPVTWSTLFYAHEVAPVRRLVEEHAGHDTRFYNVMRQGLDWNLYLDNLFGDQHDLYKVPLLHQATQCDAILAVSDLVVDELRFLGAAFQHRPLDLVYNGIPTQATTLAEKRESRSRLQAYCANLLGFAPDYVMSHVTRMVLSKGLWRDGKVLSHLARLLAQDHQQSAVLFVLSTAAVTGRHPHQIREWEQTYGWPVQHRTDNGELTGAEIPFFHDVVEPFNRHHPNVKIVFVNQFGWDRNRCGERMPADMAFADLRMGTDLEFGQSIYEPFGIAQLEPLTQGALCCTSSVCGCRGFVQQIKARGIEVPLYIEADYVALSPSWWNASPFNALDIGHALRNQVEDANSLRVAQQIHALLPRTDRTRAHYLELGQEASQAMSWEVVAQDYFIPALTRLQARMT